MNVFACELCNLISTNISDIDNHMVNHTNKKEYKGYEDSALKDSFSDLTEVSGVTGVYFYGKMDSITFNINKGNKKYENVPLTKIREENVALAKEGLNTLDNLVERIKSYCSIPIQFHEVTLYYGSVFVDVYLEHMGEKVDLGIFNLLKESKLKNVLKFYEKAVRDNQFSVDRSTFSSGEYGDHEFMDALNVVSQVFYINSSQDKEYAVEQNQGGI